MFVNDSNKIEIDASNNDNFNNIQLFFDVIVNVDDDIDNNSTTNNFDYEKAKKLLTKKKAKKANSIEIVAINIKFLFLQAVDDAFFENNFIFTQLKSVFFITIFRLFTFVPRSKKNKIVVVVVVKKQKKKVMKKRNKIETNSKRIFSNFEHERSRKKLKKIFKTRSLVDVIVKIEKKKII